LPAGEHDGASGTGFGGALEGLFEAAVADRENRKIDRLGQIGQARIAGDAVDRLVLRVDRVDATAIAGTPHRLQHVAAGRVRALTGSDERDRFRGKERRKRMIEHVQ